ncbi:MAG: hypothetical protein FJ091_01450 [Deltaproteobacteria bacterium]|nr:hypothetical protein [Deltaproteobacteria bacterium]
MKVLRWLAKALFALVVLALVAVFAPRFFTDGPLGPIPGGPLKAGELFEFPVSDWSFAADVKQIEFQLENESISRTSWILVRGGVAYVPCGACEPPMKRWQLAAQADGRALLRIEGKLYPARLTRDDDASLREFARGEVMRKYGVDASGAGTTLFFRVDSRAAGS